MQGIDIKGMQSRPQ